MAKDSPEMKRVCEAVKEAGIFVVLGYSEKSRCKSLHSQSFINPKGKTVLHRRKIKPTRESPIALCPYYTLPLLSTTTIAIPSAHTPSQTSNAPSGAIAKQNPSLHRRLPLRKNRRPQLLGTPTTPATLLRVLARRPDPRGGLAALLRRSATPVAVSRQLRSGNSGVPEHGEGRGVLRPRGDAGAE